MAAAAAPPAPVETLGIPVTPSGRICQVAAPPNGRATTCLAANSPEQAQGRAVTGAPLRSRSLRVRGATDSQPDPRCPSNIRVSKSDTPHILFNVVRQNHCLTQGDSKKAPGTAHYNTGIYLSIPCPLDRTTQLMLLGHCLRCCARCNCPLAAVPPTLPLDQGGPAPVVEIVVAERGATPPAA